MTIRNRALRTMLLLETAAQRHWRGMRAAERAAYRKSIKREERAAVTGERVTLMRGIHAGLKLLAPNITNDPAHARFLYKLTQLARKGKGAIETAPHHERAMHAMITRAVRDDLPKSGGVGAPDVPDGSAPTVQRLMDGCHACLGSTTGGLANLHRYLLNALTHVRLANHLCNGKPDEACDVVATLSADRRATLPRYVIPRIATLAGRPTPTVPLTNGQVLDFYGTLETNEADHAGMADWLSGRA